MKNRRKMTGFPFRKTLTKWSPVQKKDHQRAYRSEKDRDLTSRKTDARKKQRTKTQ
jgi:hypothetical protein